VVPFVSSNTEAIPGASTRISASAVSSCRTSVSRMLPASSKAVDRPTSRLSKRMTKNPAATNYYVGIDAIDVAGSLVLPPRRFENTDATVLGFAGSWSELTNSNLSGGSYRYSNAAGAVATATFRGSEFAWITTKAPYCGIAEVSIDGGTWQQVDLWAASASYRQPVYEKTGLGSGIHTVEIRVTGTKRVAATAAYVGVDAADIVQPTVRIEQTDAKLSWAGAWSTFSHVNLSGGDYRYVNATGAKVQVAFTGTGIDWITTKGPGFGIARVTVDGGAPVLVDLFNPTTAYRQRAFSARGLAEGPHTMVIEWTGTKRSVATNTYVGIDAFDVVGTFTPAAPLTVRFEQSDSRLLFEGTWNTLSNSNLSAGAYKWANTSGAKVTIPFNGTAISLFTSKASAYGIARVTLDGGAPELVDLYTSGATLYQENVWSRGGLSAGDHTVTLEWTGTKNTSSSNTYVGIDAVEVTGSLR